MFSLQQILYKLIYNFRRAYSSMTLTITSMEFFSFNETCILIEDTCIIHATQVSLLPCQEQKRHGLSVACQSVLLLRMVTQLPLLNTLRPRNSYCFADEKIRWILLNENC